MSAAPSTGQPPNSTPPDEVTPPSTNITPPSTDVKPSMTPPSTPPPVRIDLAAPAIKEDAPAEGKVSPRQSV